MTQHLTIKEVVTAARQAYDEGRLQAQVMSGRDCVYFDPTEGCVYFDPAEGCVCAIGAALNEDTIENLVTCDLNEGANVHDIIAADIISFPDPEQVIAAYEIQTAHDQWVGGYITANQFLEILEKYND